MKVPVRVRLGDLDDLADLSVGVEMGLCEVGCVADVMLKMEQEGIDNRSPNADRNAANEWGMLDIDGVFVWNGEELFFDMVLTPRG